MDSNLVLYDFTFLHPLVLCTCRHLLYSDRTRQINANHIYFNVKSEKVLKLFLSCLFRTYGIILGVFYVEIMII